MNVSKMRDLEKGGKRVHQCSPRDEAPETRPSGTMGFTGHLGRVSGPGWGGFPSTVPESQKSYFCTEPAADHDSCKATYCKCSCHVTYGGYGMGYDAAYD